MLIRASSGSGGGSGEVYSVKSYNKGTLSGTQTLTFSDFTKVKSCLLYSSSGGNSAYGILNDSDSLIGTPSSWNHKITAITGNKVTFTTSASLSWSAIVCGVE